MVVVFSADTTSQAIFIFIYKNYYSTANIGSTSLATIIELLSSYKTFNEFTTNIT